MQASDKRVSERFDRQNISIRPFSILNQTALAELRFTNPRVQRRSTFAAASLRILI